MAITLADFTKIWASTSPLTPYTFTDANYQQGWNFVGATPPARQMWDSIQKQNDEKLKYVVDNYLPTAGGTMTGTIYFTSAGNNIKATDDNGYLVFYGGDAGTSASIVLRGNNYTQYNNAGSFAIRATDGNTYTSLEGKPDGTLNWDGKSIPARSFGTVIQGKGTYTFNCNESGAVIFAKRGASCSVHMVSYWDAGSVKIFETGTTITITKSANSDSVTITNLTTISMVVKIINGDVL